MNGGTGFSEALEAWRQEKISFRVPCCPVRFQLDHRPDTRTLRQLILQSIRVASVRAVRRTLVELFKKPNSKFYWYDSRCEGTGAVAKLVERNQ